MTLTQRNIRRIDYRAKKIIEEEHYKMIKWSSTHHTIQNLRIKTHPDNDRAEKYTREKLVQLE